jgi:hypothetical protein
MSDDLSSDPRQDLDLGDLPPKWQALAIGTFFVLVALIFGIPWVLGHHWLWEHGRLVGPLLGAAYFFGTKGWWLTRSGLAATSEALTRVESPAHDGALGSNANKPALEVLHRRARWALIRWWGTAATIVLSLTLGIPLSMMSTSQVNNLIDSQPHQHVRIVSVRQTVGNGGPKVTVDIPDDGEQSVDYSDYLSSPRVGDYVDVVVNPADPTEVVPVAYRHSSSNDPILGIFLLIAIVAGLAYAGWFMGATKRSAARAVRAAPATVGVTVTERREAQLTVVTPRGQSLIWQLGGDRTGRTPRPGTLLQVAGDLRPGGWAGAVHRDWVLWTSKPLVSATDPSTARSQRTAT